MFRRQLRFSPRALITSRSFSRESFSSARLARCVFFSSHATEATTPPPPNLNPPSESAQTADTHVNESNPDRLRLIILDSSLSYVPLLGWTEASLVAAIRDRKLAPALIGLFPRGPIEIVEHFISKCNAQLAHDLEAMNLSEVRGMTKRIRTALKHRLEMQIPHASNWHQAMALGALPQNVPNTLRNISLMVDDIWFYCGDRSTDLNWYSKRALAASVYASTEVFMLSDKSFGFQDTWNFLDRRLLDVMNLGMTIARTAETLKSVSAFGLQFLSGVFSSSASASNTAPPPPPPPPPAPSSDETVNYAPKSENGQ